MCMLKIQTSHLIEGRAATPADLPKPGNPWLYFVNPTPVPEVVAVKLIQCWGAGTNQRHVTDEYIPELWEFVQTAPAKKSSNGRDAGIARQLVYWLAVFIQLVSDVSADKTLNVFLVRTVIVSNHHRSKLVQPERSSAEPCPGLTKECRTRRSQFHANCDHQQGRS